MSNYLDWGRDVLDKEIAALREMRDRLDESFSEAVRLIKSCESKVIVTGIGKSGHVGKKTAATFASLGTPAFFMHSTEALHGDSGMMAIGDVLMAVSYSGETAEVNAVAAKASEIGLKVIVLTGNKESTLARYSDVLIDISVRCEADHLNLAPTASSTITLALGDALAVAAARADNFDKNDFAVRHPGGQLGNKARG